LTDHTVIIGGGPAGHELALRLGRHGQPVTLIESTHMGGTCLNVGCIPTKAYLAKAKLAKTLKNLKLDITTISSLALEAIRSNTFRTIGRLRIAMEQDLQRVGVKVIYNTVIQIDNSNITLAGGITVPYDRGVLATGTTPWIPSSLQAAYSSQKNIYTNETIFSLTSIPKTITIVGGGAIGVEFAFIFSTLGSKVTLVEVTPSILGNFEPDLSKEVKRQLKLSRVNVLEGATLKEELLLAEVMLVATGRQPRLPEHMLPFKFTQKGYIETSSTYQTSQPHWFAIGDINGRSLLAHAANDQAAQLADFFIHDKQPVEKPIPSVVYSLPAVASVGLRSNEKPEGAIITNTSYNVLGKAHMEDSSEGWVRLIHKNDQLLGFHGFGVVIEDLVPLVQFAIQDKTPLSQLATLVAPHPSYGELLKLALENAVFKD